MDEQNVSFIHFGWEKFVTFYRKEVKKLTENNLNDNIFNMKIFIYAFIIIIVASLSAYADIYKYVDENGVICYTDLPLNKKADRIHKDKQKSLDDPTTQEKSRNTKKYSNAQTAEYHEIIHEKANAYNIDPSLVKAVIKTESNFNSHAISRKGAMGLMQLMPSTANDLNVQNPFDPEENIEGGVKYLKYLLEKFNGNLTLALAAYNAGPKKVEKYGYVPPITETKQYVNKVLSLYNGPTQYQVETSGEFDTKEKKVKKSDPIYKIVLDDGTILFTNSTFFSKNSNKL